MRVAQEESWLVVAAVLIAVPSLLAAPQNTDEGATCQAGQTQGEPQHGASKSETENKARLVEATRVSTADAARNAARERAKDSAKKGEAEKVSAEPSDAGVIEMKPAEGSSDTQTVRHQGDTKKSAVKNDHGTVDGSLDPEHSGNHQAAARIGASSKSGKTSVFVETDRSRTTAPVPH